MKLLLLAALLAAQTDPLPRGSRVLVVNASLASAALEEVAAARGWKVDSAPAAAPAIVAARAGHPKLLVVSAALVDAQHLAALRLAAPGARLILTQQKGEALPEMPEQVPFEVLPAPYEASALAAAVARACAPRAPPSTEDKLRLAEARAAQKEK